MNCGWAPLSWHSCAQAGGRAGAAALQSVAGLPSELSVDGISEMKMRPSRGVVQRCDRGAAVAGSHRHCTLPAILLLLRVSQATRGKVWRRWPTQVILQ